MFFESGFVMTSVQSLPLIFVITLSSFLWNLPVYHYNTFKSPDNAQHSPHFILIIYILKSICQIIFANPMD